jgi:RimJ/RimL family protein N-acetyltransferase
MTRVVTVEGDGVLLTAWTSADVPAVLDLADDEASRAWSPSLRPVRTAADALAWLASRTESPDRYDWAVRDPATGDLIGRVGLHRFDPVGRSAEIGYGVHPAHRRGGVAVRAVAAACGHGFGALALARIGLVHAVGNSASCRVAARSGFAYEGLHRSVLDHGDGVLHDVHVHARLADDPPGPAAPAPGAAQPIEPVEIAAGRLQLRPPTDADAADALAMLQDPDVARWNQGPDGLDLDVARAWCRRGADWSSGEHATFSVLDATSGRLLGNVSLHQIDRAEGDAEIGYRVAPWARGRGVATDSVAAVSRWAFGALDLVRIELAHAVLNPASCRVAEKAGYPLEGTLRASYVYGDGRRYDEHLHARLASDPEPPT